MMEHKCNRRCAEAQRFGYVRFIIRVRGQRVWTTGGRRDTGVDIITCYHLHPDYVHPSGVTVSGLRGYERAISKEQQTLWQRVLRGELMFARYRREEVDNGPST